MGTVGRKPGAAVKVVPLQAVVLGALVEEGGVVGAGEEALAAAGVVLLLLVPAEEEVESETVPDDGVLCAGVTDGAAFAALMVKPAHVPSHHTARQTHWPAYGEHQSREAFPNPSKLL